MDKVWNILNAMHEINAASLTKLQKDPNQVTASKINHWSNDGKKIGVISRDEAKELVKVGTCYVLSSHDIAEK